MLTIRHSEAQDALDLAYNLRQADAEEIKASTGNTPLASLISGYIESDECFSVVEGTKVVAMFGVGPLLPSMGGVWLLMSDELLKSKYRRRFLMESKRIVAEFHSRYDILINFVDARNLAALRWLEWLGFNTSFVIPEFGVAKIPFHRVVRVSHV